jgi:hypothetical protein
MIRASTARIIPASIKEGKFMVICSIQCPSRAQLRMYCQTDKRQRTTYVLITYVNAHTNITESAVNFASFSTLKRVDILSQPGRSCLEGLYRGKPKGSSVFALGISVSIGRMGGVMLGRQPHRRDAACCVRLGLQRFDQRDIRGTGVADL